MSVETRMEYTAIPFTPTPERAGVVSHVLRSLCAFDNVFTDYAKACERKCFECPLCVSRMAQASAVLAKPDTRVWEIWDDAGCVGIVYLTDISPGVDALAHYAFFDGKLRDKEELLLAMIDWVFEDHPETGWKALRRLTLEIPDFAKALALHATRGLGFGGDFSYTDGNMTVNVEGVKRNALEWRGSLRNVLVLGKVRP